MKFLLSREATITLIVVAILIFLIGFYLLYKFIIVKQKNKQLQRKASIKYSYVKSILLVEDAQHIRRIEGISNLNLLWNSKYQEFYRRFEHLRDFEDRKASKAIQQINDGLLRGNKEFKAAYNANRPIIDQYENKVQQLNRDLINELRPESEIREEVVADKERYREIKASYKDNKEQLELVEQQFEQLFSSIDNLFADFETLLEGAYFDEARVISGKIKKFIYQMDITIEKMPMLCVKATLIIPNKLSKLKEKAREIEESGIPIQHLFVRQNIEEYQLHIEQIERKIKKFEIKNLDVDLDKIDAGIDRLIDSFNTEINDKQDFETKFETIYRHVNNVENKFIRLKNNLPKLKEIYLFSEVYSNKIDRLQILVNDLSNSKRQIDSFIHSSTKQPYSVLTSKSEMLYQESINADNEIEEFLNYIITLRNDSQEAFKLSKEYFYSLKNMQYVLREFDIEEFSSTLNGAFEREYEIIDEIIIIVNSKPINMELVNKMKKEMVAIYESISFKYNRGLESARLAEEVIVHLNRYRSDYTEVQQRVIDEEVRFFNAGFDDVYNNCLNTLKRFSNKQ